MLSSLFTILSIFVMIAIGVYLARRFNLAEGFSGDLSKLLINVFYPAILYASIVKTFTLEQILGQWVLPVGAAGLIVVGWLAGWLIRPFLRRKMTIQRRRAIHFSLTTNNYSFLPIMVMISLMGERGVALVALSALGSDLLMWTLGFSALTGRQVSLQNIRRILSMPVVAILCALVTIGVRHVMPEMPAVLTQGWEALLKMLSSYLGQATIPVSAIVCGLNMAKLSWGEVFSRWQWFTAAMRMVVLPVLICGILMLIPMAADTRLVLGVIACMPGAMMGVSMAEVYGGDRAFLAGEILLTHLLALATLPLAIYLIG